MTASRQKKYYGVYRGRQSWLFHLAYMRLGKVLGVMEALERQGVTLEEKRVFDYGFGAGTFFRHCPKSAELFGVELDGVHVENVARALKRRGYAHVDLRVVEEDRWQEHGLLVRQYDVVVVSHVLEHVKQPVELLNRLVGCAGAGGVVVAVLPINELVCHDNHEWRIERGLVEGWAASAGARVADYFEFDPFGYYALPVFEKSGLAGRAAAQALSVGLGLAATAAGRRFWFRLGGHFGRVTGAKAAQAVCVFCSGKHDGPTLV